jgi:NAD(P)-dependent dehydrogenase (short-subunit alcohol dehydrogenase family)
MGFPRLIVTLKPPEMGNLPENISDWLFDAGCLEQIQGFVKGWGDQKIDVLLHNAGVMAIPYTKTADKQEHQMQVNFYSVVMLTELLMPLLTETARVCVVSSIAHRRGAALEPSFMEVFQKYMAEDLSEEGYDKWVAYAVAKSAVIMYHSKVLTASNFAGGKSDSYLFNRVGLGMFGPYFRVFHQFDSFSPYFRKH